MSKSGLIAVLFAMGMLLAAHATGQHVEVAIRIDGQTVTVRGRNVGAVSKDPAQLVFLDSVLGVNKLADRIADVEAADAEGKALPLKRFAASTYVAGGAITEWRYKIDLRPLPSQIAAAHTSWITGDTGMLMLDDLLPQYGRSATRVTLKAPAGWNIMTAEASNADTYVVRDTEKAVFFIGRNWRKLSAGDSNIVISGDWQFADADVSKIAGQIFIYYSHLFGTPKAGSLIAITKFPNHVQPGQWEADTRGSTVTIVSSDAPFKSQSVQRLDEQLRHEIFHLWFPNGVNLSGNYDWFYEGFALYQALKLGLATNRIRFADYLATLSAAYNIDRRISRRVSLIDASKNRAGGGGLDVYARGMLVAFLADVALLEASKGKRSTDDIIREIYQKHSAQTERIDGNEAILSVLRRRPELIALIDRYITGVDPSDLTPAASAAGIEVAQAGREFTLQIAKKPTSRQKDILNKLGYNNWRKSIPK